MASFQKSQDIDILKIKKLYVKGENNSTIPINNVLITDGNGGTKWVDISIINSGVAFNTIITSPITLQSQVGNTTLSILDGSNAGLLASSSNNTVTMYAKAFGQINVEGQNSIYSFNTFDGTITSNINLSGSGVINISTDTNNNIINFSAPNDAISSMSTTISNLSSLNTILSTSINSFTSPFSTFIYEAISSFSTAIGPTVQFPQLFSTLSSFSTVIGPTVQFPQLFSTLSSFSTAIGPTVQFRQLHSTISSFSTVLGPIVTRINFSTVLSNTISSQLYTRTLNTSTVNVMEIRQPIIQYGILNIPNSGSNIVSITPYVNSNYIVTTTYANMNRDAIRPLRVFNPTPSNFIVFGDQGSQFYWTTYGNFFV
jgi:hypothetical protein